MTPRTDARDGRGLTRRTFIKAAAGGGMTAALAATGALPALAQTGTGAAKASEAADDLLLGSFFVDENADGSRFRTVLATSRTGTVWEQIGVPYDANHNPFHDPAIVYKDGGFWVFSNWRRNDQKFWPMIGWSRNLVDWTAPEGQNLINDGAWQGITFDRNPFGLGQIDTVAPDAFVDDDGTLYLVITSGFYGAWHGQPERDRMAPYLVKFDRASIKGGQPWKYNGQYLPDGLTLSATQARYINLPGPRSDNRIDASLSKRNGTYYLCIKRDGVNNEIYSNTRVDVNGWKLVKDGIAMGTEGPSMAKLDGSYIMVTDKISTYPANGGQNGLVVSAAKTPGSNWSARQDVQCVTVPWDLGTRVKLRHGSVIALPAAAHDLVQKRRVASKWPADRPTFLDVQPGSWYYIGSNDVDGYVTFVCKRGLMTGIKNPASGLQSGYFGSEDQLIRGQVATILFRYANPNSTSTTDPSKYQRPTSRFNDLPKNPTYYNAAIEWCAKNGIVNGYTYAGTTKPTGKFGPDNPVTREELALMVYRFAQKQKADVTVKASTKAAFNKMPDRKKVSSWAAEALLWCFDRKILTGWVDKAHGNKSYLQPQNLATRTQAAKIFTVLVRDVLKK